ncbi:uncharacterized protein QC763_0111460 [Podospora pseudopauciseta]|uniref:Uncharacterized protein n=1 Tax=Podospora pseudopauciseta TaxID=2093780 RepID=A0ABR0H2N8_9PEZI|nr:hypothetical protein QC763_0111460 [Podospora pseudopauciseta]
MRGRGLDKGRRDSKPDAICAAGDEDCFARLIVFGNSDNPIIDSIADKGIQDQHNLISGGLVVGFLWPSERTNRALIADDYEFDENSGVVPDDLRARAGLSKPEPLRGPLCVWFSSTGAL